LGLVGTAHAINLFHFPYYEADEGTYMSQAWALVTKGSLAPYTYTYDHAPGGGILIAAMMTRPLVLVGAIVAAGIVERKAGLAAALLAAVVFSVHLAITLVSGAMAPRRPTS